MFDSPRVFLRFAFGLQAFLRDKLDPAACANLIAASIESRQQNFLAVLRRAVYDFPASPYLPLLRRAGATYSDLESLVEREGIEATLKRLASGGVLISIDEFKGKTPNYRSEDFDNPLLLKHFSLLSGGSTGKRRRLAIDLDLLVFEAATQWLFLDTHGLLHRPMGLWRPVPPGSSGIKHVLRGAKIGKPVSRWFNLSGDRREDWQWALLLRATQFAGVLHRGTIPAPEPLPLSNPKPVADWLAFCASQGQPAVLSCPASAAVRVAKFALSHAMDIRGSIFWAGGEPITIAKTACIEEAGASVVNGWSLSEAGPIGIGCLHRTHPDEVHVLHSKVCVIPHADGPNPSSEGSPLLLTSLLPHAPKLLLNVDAGDRAVLSNRACGCPIERSGFPHHLHSIRAEGKLTAGGMHFVHSDLVALVEEVLPSRFGGSSIDYQFAENDSAAEATVILLVSPLVPSIDPNEVVSTIAQYFRTRSSGDSMMADYWQANGILRVLRHEPLLTPTGKILPVTKIDSRLKGQMDD